MIFAIRQLRFWALTYLFADHIGVAVVPFSVAYVLPISLMKDFNASLIRARHIGRTASKTYWGKEREREFVSDVCIVKSVSRAMSSLS